MKLFVEEWFQSDLKSFIVLMRLNQQPVTATGAVYVSVDMSSDQAPTCVWLSKATQVYRRSVREAATKGLLAWQRCFFHFCSI